MDETEFYDTLKEMNPKDWGNYGLCRNFEKGCFVNGSTRNFCRGDGIIRHYAHSAFSVPCDKFEPLDDVAICPGSEENNLEIQANEILISAGFDPNNVT